MPRRALRLPFALVALALAAPLAPAASFAAPCPESSVTLGGGTVSSTAAVFDASDWTGTGDWDMVAGRVHMYSTGSLSGVTVDAFDDFDVTGVPAGTPVSVRAELTIDGAVWTDGCGGSGCGGLYDVKFFHGTDSLEVLHSDHLFSGRLDHHDVIQLPITITAGQPERLEVRALGRRTPGGSHYSEATCVLAFTGLDAGVGVTSCKGFAGTVVPVRPASWGRLKTIYR